MARVSPRPNFRGGVFLVIKTMFLQSLTIKYMYMYAITSTIKFCIITSVSHQEINAIYLLE
mgnify:CR=1 FL=1